VIAAVVEERPFQAAFSELRARHIFHRYAALKRRSSTVLKAALAARAA
jgi:hypothetical protein